MSEREIDLLNFIVADTIFKLLIFICSNKRTRMQYFDSDTTKYKVRIIEKARRAKKEVGKRSKSKQPDKIETENGKPGTRKVSFRVILIVVSVHDITLPALALK